MSSRIETAFANAKAQGRGILGVFVTAGDPDEGTSAQILDALVEANVDIVELGMPFSDPMADGPAIQAASLRALKNGMTLAGTLEITSLWPMEWAKVQIQLNKGVPGWSLMGDVRRVGMGLYKGLPAMLVGVPLQGAVRFTTLDAVKALVTEPGTQAGPLDINTALARKGAGADILMPGVDRDDYSKRKTQKKKRGRKNKYYRQIDAEDDQEAD